MHRVLQVCLLFGLLSGLPVCAISGDDSEKSAAHKAQKTSRRPPLVVMQETEVAGRVFILADSKNEEMVASGIKVKILAKDRKKPIYEATTDKTGSYLIPKMRVGDYSMVIGRLRLRLSVVARKAEDSKDPKTILVFLPKELR